HAGMGVAPGMAEVALAAQHPGRLQEVIGDVVLGLEADEQDEEQLQHVQASPSAAVGPAASLRCTAVAPAKIPRVNAWPLWALQARQDLRSDAETCSNCSAAVQNDCASSAANGRKPGVEVCNAKAYHRSCRQCLVPVRRRGDGR